MNRLTPPPIKIWKCGCVATSPRHIRICSACGKGGHRAIKRSLARLRKLQKETK